MKVVGIVLAVLVVLGIGAAWALDNTGLVNFLPDAWQMEYLSYRFEHGPLLQIPSRERVTLKNYRKVKEDMSRSEVVKLLGEGEEIMGATSDGKTTELTRWTTKNGGQLDIAFVNNRVAAKSQIGLE